MQFNKEYYIKTLVKEVFGKTEEKSLQRTKHGLCNYIAAKLGVMVYENVIAIKTLERVYEHFIENKNPDYKVSSKTLKLILLYGGYDSYEAFVKIHNLSLDIEKMSYAMLNNLDKEELEKYIRLLVEFPERRNQNELQLFWLGVLLLKQYQYESALEFLSMALTINPAHGECHYNLALAKFYGKRPFRLRMKEIKAILYHLNIAIRINPNKAKLYCLKAFIYHDYHIRHGLRIPENVIIPEYLMEAEENLGELERAAQLLGVSKKQFIEI